MAFIPFDPDIKGAAEMQHHSPTLTTMPGSTIQSLPRIHEGHSFENSQYLGDDSIRSTNTRGMQLDGFAQAFQQGRITANSPGLVMTDRRDESLRSSHVTSRSQLDSRSAVTSSSHLLDPRSQESLRPPASPQMMRRPATEHDLRGLSRGISSATEQQRRRRSETELNLPPGTRIISDRIVEHEVRVPKRVMREEIVETVTIVPETRLREEFEEVTQVIHEKIIEVAKPVITEKIVEYTETEYVETVVEYPEIITKETIREVPRIEYVENIVQIPKIVIAEKVVELPEIEYREITSEKIVEVPEVHETIVIKEKIVPQYVDKPFPEYKDVLEEREVHRLMPVPVQAETTLELILPRIRTNTTNVDLPLYVPRFVEVAVPFELFDDQTQTDAENYAQQISMLSAQSTASLCEIENLAASLRKADFEGNFRNADVGNNWLTAVRSGRVQVDATRIPGGWGTPFVQSRQPVGVRVLPRSAPTDSEDPSPRTLTTDPETAEQEDVETPRASPQAFVGTSDSNAFIGVAAS